MSARHFCSALFITAAVVAAISCKKDEEQETKPSLSGNLRFSGLPEYISAVERDVNGNAIDKGGNIVDIEQEEADKVDTRAYKEYDVTPSRMSRPEGGPVGYYWKQNPSTDNTPVQNDTATTEDGSTVLKFKDSLYTCTVTCGAFADGYYDSSVSTYTMVVNPGVGKDKSIKGAIDEDDEFIYDKRVGKEGEWKKYYVTEIKIDDNTSRRWFRQNLEYNYEDKDDIKPAAAFKDCEVMGGIYGRYYTYAQITDKENPVCPEGWHVATEQDWIDLGKALKGTFNGKTDLVHNEKIEGIAHKMMADATFNGERMWTYWREVRIDNESRLSVLPAGWAICADGNIFLSSSETVNNIHDGIQYAAFIIPDESESDDLVRYRYLISNSTTLFTATGDNSSFAASVRCVENY